MNNDNNNNSCNNSKCRGGFARQNPRLAEVKPSAAGSLRGSQRNETLTRPKIWILSGQSSFPPLWETAKRPVSICLSSKADDVHHRTLHAQSNQKHAMYITRFPRMMANLKPTGGTRKF